MTARRVVIAAGRRPVALAGEVLAGHVPACKAALGKFLVGSPGRAGTALAAGRPITPATRGSVVFVVIAGHE
jgi:hypothetical protein